MSKDLVILGCGGFGREVADVVTAINHQTNVAGSPTPWTFLGFIDDAPSAEDEKRVADLGSSVLGSADVLTDYSGSCYVVGVNSGAVRQRLADRADEAGLVPATLIHPTATVGANVTVLDGSIICAGVRLTTNIHVGRHVHLNINTTVGHDSILEDFSTANPLVAISGNCRLRQRCVMGTHSSVLQGLTIGADARVGAGACVVRDVEPGVTVKGVPAR